VQAYFRDNIAKRQPIEVQAKATTAASTVSHP
jgi:hypothetical protein